MMTHHQPRLALMILYSFPPAGGPGVQRGLKFVKYLPDFGWQTVVLTVNPRGYRLYDASLQQDIPASTRIYRVDDPNINRLRPHFSRFKLGHLITGLNMSLMLPDASLFWAKKAQALAERLIATYQPTVIYSSSPPETTHLLAKRLKQKFGLPWLADFRDMWSENPQRPYLPGYRKLNRQLEQDVLRHADRVATVSPPLVETLQRLSPQGPEQALLLENGYDEGAVERLPPPQTSKFTISYMGTINPNRRPHIFVEAVQALLNSGQIPVEELRIPVAGKNVEQHFPHEPPFEQLGYLSHPELAELRQNSNLLLLLVDDSPASYGTYSGKVFEYLACNRPTLAVTSPKNVAAQLIERANAGRVAPFEPQAIAETILHHYRLWKSGQQNYQPDWAVIEAFTRRKLTQRLAHAFNELAA